MKLIKYCPECGRKLKRLKGDELKHAKERHDYGDRKIIVTRCDKCLVYCYVPEDVE